MARKAKSLKVKNEKRQTKDKVTGRLLANEFEQLQMLCARLMDLSDRPGATPANIACTMALDLLERAQEILAPVCEPEADPAIPGEPRPSFGDLIYKIAQQPDGPIKLAFFAKDFSESECVNEINNRYTKEWSQNAAAYCGGSIDTQESNQSPLSQTEIHEAAEWAGREVAKLGPKGKEKLLAGALALIALGDKAGPKTPEEKLFESAGFTSGPSRAVQRQLARQVVAKTNLKKKLDRKPARHPDE